MVQLTPSDPEVLPAGALVGDYELLALIGRGGFARVYKARHQVLRSEVAIKVISRALALDTEASERFVREARAASRIVHPNVVRVLGFGVLADGRAFQIMELVEGGPLDDYLAERVIDTEEALRILSAIADALGAAHAVHIIHRDLKPANVLMGPGGKPRLADFGIAKALEAEDDPRMTRTGVTLGTPIYMSPEQALGRDVGPASDIYSFGVVAFEVLTGSVPFEGESLFETMLMHVQRKPPLVSERKPALGTRFDAAVDAMLAKHPADRPTSLERAVAMLRAVPGQAPAVARRRPRARAAIAVAVGLAIVATTAAVWTLREGPAPKQPSAAVPTRPAAAPALPVPPTPSAASAPSVPPSPAPPAAPTPRLEPVVPAPGVPSAPAVPYLVTRPKKTAAPIVRDRPRDKVERVPPMPAKDSLEIPADYQEP